MTLDEVWNMTYDEYVQYLLNKYGAAQCNYFTPDWKKNPNRSRTSEGLECHHIDEDKYPLLSNEMIARQCPYEFQKADRLVYADRIEHLLLHVKLCREGLGVGWDCGVKTLIQATNEMYQTPPTSGWQLNVYNKIKDHFDVYIEILDRILLLIWNDDNVTVPAPVIDIIKEESLDSEEQMKRLWSFYFAFYIVPDRSGKIESAYFAHLDNQESNTTPQVFEFE